MSNRNNDTLHELANMGWGMIVFLWMCWWPLGFGLTIGKLAARRKLEEQQRQGWGSVRRAPGPGEYNYRPTDPRHSRDYTGTTRAAGSTGEADSFAEWNRTQTTTAQPPRRTPLTAEQNKASAARKLAVPLLLIFGAMFALGGLSMVLEGFDSLVWLMQEGLGWSSWPITEEILPGLISAIGGLGLFRAGRKKSRMAKMEKRLISFVGPRDHVTIKELSAACDMNQKETVELVQSAIEHGAFGGSAYLDMLSKTLVVRGSAPAPAPTKEEAKAPQPKKAAARKEDQYQAILRQLREANEDIPGKEMSDKIDRMEQVSARIFALAKQDPNKESQLTRFMDYYLPTSLKLLRTYADLDKPGIRGENIDETKRSIEQAMDLLVTAFENQLDKLYESDALDVSSEISALQGMLNLDGLVTPTDFTAPAEQWQKDTEL